MISIVLHIRNHERFVIMSHIPISFLNMQEHLYNLRTCQKKINK